MVLETPLDESPLPERVRKARESKGLSLRAAAERIGDGVHFTTLGKLEAGSMELTVRWLERLANAYDIDIRDLISGSSNQAGTSLPLFDGADINGVFSKAEWIAKGTVDLPISSEAAFAVSYSPSPCGGPYSYVFGIKAQNITDVDGCIYMVHMTDRHFIGALKREDFAMIGIGPFLGSRLGFGTGFTVVGAVTFMTQQLM